MHIIKLLAILCLCLMHNHVLGADTNLFNPYFHTRLPSQSLSNDGAEMAKMLGASKSNLQDEVSYRQYWRNEVYPVVFGNVKSKNEVIVFIDYANLNSEFVWAQVLAASKMMDVQKNKIVVFAKNSEKYGTELMGGGIWVTYSRPAYGLDYFNYTLRKWNEVKRTLATKGITRPFVYEYDATAHKKDFPILYSYLSMLKPALTQTEYSHIMQYAFDAGNINMYQAAIAANQYGVENFPAVVVNGNILKKVNAQNIVEALQQ